MYNAGLKPHRGLSDFASRVLELKAWTTIPDFYPQVALSFPQVPGLSSHTSTDPAFIFSAFIFKATIAYVYLKIKWDRKKNEVTCSPSFPYSVGTPLHKLCSGALGKSPGISLFIACNQIEYYSMGLYIKVYIKGNLEIKKRHNHQKWGLAKLDDYM